MEKPTAAIDIFGKLKEESKQVIVFLMNFLKELDTPSIVEKTQMGKDNLCMVFAPSFLRCTFTDPVKMLKAAGMEKGFVMSLWDSLPFTPSPRVAFVPKQLLLEREEKYIPYYADYFGDSGKLSRQLNL